jgi:SAM-dependent methyltransferase
MTELDADLFNDFERHGWAENDADAYDRVFGPVTQRVIDDLLDAAGVGDRTRVLDVATGPGYVAARASSRGARAVGVDLSPQMLERARRTHPDIDFRQADAEDLRLASASFDAVVANFCLLHVGRPERVAAEFVRVLAPGGRAAATVWSSPERARLFGLVPDAVRAAGASAPVEIPPGPDFFRFSSEVEFSRLLSSAGLQGISVRTIEFTQTFPTEDHLWDGMLDGSVRTRALLRLQTEEVRRRIRSEFDHLLEGYHRKRGFDVPVSVTLASGRKP